MPVRIVPKHDRNRTGLVPNSRTQTMTACASTLERAFLLLLDFDPDVELYEEHPLTITYPDETGQRRPYTPDVLVRYRPACVEVGRAKAHLCEGKSRQVCDLETVLVTDTETGAMSRATVRALKPVEPIPEGSSAAEADAVANIKDADWQRAWERFEMIRPLRETPDCPRVLVHAQAASVGRHPATLYRWIQHYRRPGRLSTLVPAKRGVRARHHRRAPDGEAVLATTSAEGSRRPPKRSVS